MEKIIAILVIIGLILFFIGYGVILGIYQGYKEDKDLSKSEKKAVKIFTFSTLLGGVCLSISLVLGIIYLFIQKT